MGMKLFDSDSDQADEISKIEVNEEFARRYEHNKQREDIQRLEELQKKGIFELPKEYSSSDEDEVSKLSKEKELKFIEALIKVKNKDPILKNKDAKLFESESESESVSGSDKEREKNEKKEKKSMFLKDVPRHLIEEGESEDEDEEEENLGKSKVKSYSEEQEELRKDFLEAVEKMDGDEDGGEEFLKVKDKGKGKAGEESEDDDMHEKFDVYFGKDETLDEKDKFLKDYFMNRRWEEVKDEKGGLDENFKLSEDEKEIWWQEDYEMLCNFRHEENAGDRVEGHSRVVEGSVRKKTNVRKLLRERKEERIARQEEERREELKRLKNLKKKEMKEKLEKIKEIAGIGDDRTCALDEDDLEEEFDPQEHDNKMKQVFNDAYYEAEDVDPEFGSDDDDDDEVEKPDFDKEDEMLGLSKGWDDVDEPSGEFLSGREKILKSKNQINDHGSTLLSGGMKDQAVEHNEGKRKKQKTEKTDSAEIKAVKDQLMDEYYKLDYEDTIGDLKTRFKYRPVKGKRYGLSAEALLLMDEKELNQHVSLKKLAPYREKEWKIPNMKRYQLKQRGKELLRGETSDGAKIDQKNTRGDYKKKLELRSQSENEKAKQEESKDDTSKESRRSRKRRSQAELKLPVTRLMAYGVVPSKSKSKKK